MTKKQLDNDRLNAAVALEVFGPDRPARFADVPPYSTDIAAAWTVADEVRERGPGVMFTLQYVPPVSKRDKKNWMAAFHGWGVAWGTTAPEAICRAALAGALAYRKYGANANKG